LCRTSRKSRIEGAAEGAGSADFDDVIDAALAGEAPDLFVPLGVSEVVDGFRGAEGLGAGELFVAAGGDDEFGASGDGELKSEGRR
jgi:hypothetical protein